MKPIPPRVGRGKNGNTMQLTVVGCGDAFGAGNRLQTAYFVRSRTSTFLIDCGATTLIGLSRLGLSPNDIDTVYVSHLHGDHIGGLPWLLIHAKYVGLRTRPLVVVGPKTTEERFITLTEAVYPGTLDSGINFDLVFVEHQEQTPLELNGVSVTPFEVHHPSGAPPYAMRFDIDGKTLSFTGDTGWVDVLPEVSRGADLFISECFQYDIEMAMHLDYKTIDANYERLAAKRVLLTHMGQEMLEARAGVDPSRYELAEDGMVIDL
jgi:ribonuclease BN (tRNA processing enzyme)